MTRISYLELAEALAATVTPGRDLMIHASLRELGSFCCDVKAIVEALSESVGPDGTLLMMTDTRSFAKTGRFDMAQPSETGLLTETFRQCEDVSRSVVPMVSFAAKGPRADTYLQTYHSHLDPTAPLTRLLDNDGHILLMGVDYVKCTLYHLAEERRGSSTNFYKTFSGKLVDGNRTIAPISQRYFVRREMSVKKDPTIAGELCEARGQVKAVGLGKGRLLSFKARDFDQCCMDILKQDPKAFIVKSNDGNQ